jgi:hypothetical protein
MAPRLELFPFRYRNPRTGKWVRARYVAERHEIAERFTEFEILGPAEVRDVDTDARAFTLHRILMARSHLPAGEPPQNEPPQPEQEPGKDPPVKEPPETEPPVREPPSEEPGTLEGVERILLLVFLRRYVTHCARRRRYAAMNGAAQLFVELSHPRGTL